VPAHLLEPHERRSEIVKFRLTAAELKELKKASKSQEVNISDLIRHFVEEGLESFKRQGIV
jgi:hypothetical protein|tara:strand:- start:683 stop:865 length:183 start_codon:yes stop_codon:yes gene_type:complete